MTITIATGEEVPKFSGKSKSEWRRDTSNCFEIHRVSTESFHAREVGDGAIRRYEVG